MNDLIDSTDPIRSFQSELRNMSLAAESLRPLVRVCQDAIQRSGCKAHVTVDTIKTRTPAVRITMICDRLEETVNLFRELAKEGLHTDKNDSHKDHNAFGIIAMREYKLGRDLTVVAMVGLGGGKDGDSGPRCRMEQVGVKEVPVYEMKCD